MTARATLQELRGRLGRDVGSTFGANLVGAGAAFAGGLVLARWLGPSLRGLFELGLFAVNATLLVFGLGVNLPVAVFGTKDPARGVWAYRFGLYWLTSLLLVIGLLLVGASRLADPGGSLIRYQGIALGAMAAFAALFFNQQVSALLVGLGRIGWMNAGVAVRWVTYLAGLLALSALVGADAEIGLAWFAVSALAGAIVAGRGIAAFDRSARRATEGRDSWRSTVWFGIRGQLGNIFQFASYRFDVLLVGLWVGRQGLGVYAVGVTFAEALWLLPNAVGTVLLSHTPRSSTQDADRRVAVLLPATLAIVGVGAVLLSVATPLIASWYLGAAYAKVPLVTWLLMPGAVALSGAKVLANELTARGFPGINAGIAALGAVITLLGDVLLIPRYGIVGASLASTIGYTMIFLLLLRAFSRRSAPTGESSPVP